LKSALDRPAFGDTSSISEWGSLSNDVGPSSELSTGSGRQPMSPRPWARIWDSTMPLHAAMAAGSLGKKMLPAAYSPAGGSVMPSSALTALRRKPSGMPVRMPAPSPEAGSQPQPPRCAMRTSITFASLTIEWLAWPFKCATMPTPHESTSRAASYSPCGFGKRESDGGLRVERPREPAATGRASWRSRTSSRSSLINSIKPRFCTMP
jgi:hypothetical protein